MLKRWTGALALLALLALALPARADVYAGPQAFTATGTLILGTGGSCTVVVTATGSPSGATFAIEGSSDPATISVASSTWTALQASVVGGTTFVTSMTAAGKWAVNVAGMTRARVNLSAISSGTVTFTMDGGSGCAVMNTH